MPRARKPPSVRIQPSPPRCSLIFQYLVPTHWHPKPLGRMWNLRAFWGEYLTHPHPHSAFRDDPGPASAQSQSTEPH